jgi:hypothetical protein
MAGQMDSTFGKEVKCFTMVQAKARFPMMLLLALARINARTWATVRAKCTAVALAMFVMPRVKWQAGAKKARVEHDTKRICLTGYVL